MVGNNSFKVGLYIRLSRDDGNVESDSIVSQRSLLNQYVKENNYKIVPICSYAVKFFEKNTQYNNLLKK